ncbi:MAG: endonuclease III [Bacteroidetes bacterium GWE2_39_28]|nr:MAG: endonuclease III [Bacteroidetes bacterium GWE2_39_28]OFY15528.1 MAG: endonuclease III [Bacteroidetes bacterium GWF2_39_10]OFZ09253.1 MAG: endonuclease III [Bacteroidetes bacterium RIFOXYB2_FULL_39_7]OFZ10550.1 MAG: endonuclease III [Bacteroidetes bacterium RIFOXYC2_FULL_39_11]HCT94475.1 endonuclease III [Rikenellaceae bacterium]
MKKKERYRGVIEWFVQNMPVAESELNYENPYQLVVAVILSAQCTDKRVNLVTPIFFERFPDASTLSEASEQEIFNLIKSVTYPNNKSKSLSGMARMLVNDFSSVVPSDPLLLQKLPGVGRKTANVIASVIYNIPVIAVDTHVYRISRRLGLSTANTPLGVELDLTENIPEHLRATAHHWLILHGRYVCIARKPKCSSCGLSPFCLHYHKSGGADLHKGSTV